MKKCPVYRNICWAIGMCVLLSGYAGAAQENWKVLREDAYRNRFAYDAASVKRTPAGTITVWAESTGAKYLYEIDCKSRKLVILEGPGAAPQRWFPLMANSADEMLFNEVCP